MSTEVLMTDQDLNFAFAMLQKKYFGKLRPCECWFQDMHMLGQFGSSFTPEGEFVKYFIRISKKIAWSRSLIYMTLLHEMVHLKLHGKEPKKIPRKESRMFNAEMKKLAARGAFVGWW